MNIVEHVGNLGVGHIAESKIPFQVMDHALFLRQSSQVKDAVESVKDLLELDALTGNEQTLFRTRIAGSMATRLALGSYISPDTTPLFGASIDEQTGQLTTLLEAYADGGARGTSTLNPDSETDPLQNFSHFQTRGLVYGTRSREISFVDRANMLKSYIDVRTGGFPPSPYAVNPVGRNDSVLVQAFGRDSITDKELTGIKEKRSELHSDDLMMEYLDSIDFLSGPSNEALADEVSIQLTGAHPTEQILQWEVAFALWKNHRATYESFRRFIHVLWPHGDSYPTFDVKADSIRVMDRFGLYNPKEFAHPDMMVRALGILNKQGVIADPLDADIPFDEFSTQPHVRSEKAWIGREFLTRGHHVAFGHVALGTQKKLY